MKRYLRRKSITEKGITLVALVVTIIILIILATISINLLLGRNGILTKAKEILDDSKIASIQEEIMMAVGAAVIDGEGTITYANLNNELANAFPDGDYTITPANDANEWTIARRRSMGKSKQYRSDYR